MDMLYSIKRYNIYILKFDSFFILLNKREWNTTNKLMKLITIL